MSQRYAITGTGAVAKTVLALLGSATQRAGVYYISIGNNTGTPADGALHCTVKKMTTDGTEGAAVLPQPLVAGDAAAGMDAGETYSAEPTYDAVPWIEVGFNQRSLYQWYAQEGGEIVTAKAAGDGLGIVFDAQTTGTATLAATIHFRE